MNTIKHSNGKINVSRLLAAMLLALGSVFFVVGCDDQGPAEEAGEAIDDAMDDAGDAMEDAADDVDDELDNDNDDWN